MIKECEAEVPPASANSEYISAIPTDEESDISIEPVEQQEEKSGIGRMNHPYPSN